MLKKTQAVNQPAEERNIKYILTGLILSHGKILSKSMKHIKILFVSVRSQNETKRNETKKEKKEEIYHWNFYT